jgi:hypothetical protein
MSKYITIADILTAAEIDLCIAQYKKDPLGFTLWCRQNVICPNIERINAELGQQNSAHYLAYLITYLMNVHLGG